MASKTSAHGHGAKMEIILHLGAHKTATTYIQQSLFLSAAALGDKGVFIVPTIEYRKALELIRNKSTFLDRLAPVRTWRVRQFYKNFLHQAEKSSSKRLVLSEEGFLGSIHQLTNEGKLYQQEKLKRNLTACVSRLRGYPITAMLAIRSYDSFYTSAWCQTVKEQGYRTFDDALKSQLIQVERGWFNVISDICSILPEGSQFRVWRLEDFKKNEMSVFSEFVGSENLGQITLHKKKLLPGLSSQAVIQLENLHLRGDPTPRPIVLEMVKKYSKFKGFPDFSPWNETEEKILVDRYEADISRIRSQWPEMMIC